MIIQRVMAVLAAVFLVGAVALAMLGPGDVSLGRLLFVADRGVLDGLHDMVTAQGGRWMWDNVVMPLLLRPAWLLPVSFALVCGGASLSLASRQRGPHRRSGGSRRWF